MKHSILLVAFAALLLAGCTPKPEDSTDPGKTGKPGATTAKKYKIAVIPKGTTHEFWKSIHAGAVDAGNELGAEIIWDGPIAESEKDAQGKIVENQVNAKVDAIVLAPLDNMSLRIPVQNAIDKKIPVIIIDSGLNEVKTVSFVATDNVKGGQLAGERMVKILNGKGKVILLRYAEGSASTMDREKGFLEVVEKEKGIQVVSKDRYAGATTETAQKESENLIAAFKKADGTLSVDAIFCPNESSTFGMLRALEGANLAGKVKLLGFDASEKLVKALKDGVIDSLVLQDPYTMGYKGVKAAIETLQGKKVDERIDTGETLVTKDIMEQDAIKKLLTPKQIDKK